VKAATGLVTREVKRKKVADAAALQKALEIAEDIEVPIEDLLKESIVEAAHQVIELIEDLQQLVKTGDILNAAEETRKEETTLLEATALEATRGNTNSHNIYNAIEVESSSTSASHSTYVSTSSYIDDIPLNSVYANLHKSFSPLTIYQTPEKA
jgi:kynureninase